MHTIASLKETIVEVLGEAEVHILDPRQDGIHLEALVISKKFEGIPLFKQHQLVMNGLKKYFDTSLHALGLKTFTPDAWELEKGQYL